MKRSFWPGRWAEGSHMPPEAGLHCLHRLTAGALQYPGSSLFGLQAPKPFGEFVVKALPALHRWEILSSSVGFPCRTAQLPRNVPGHVLPVPNSPGFAPLILLGSPKDRNVCGLPSHVRASSKSPPCTALNAHLGGPGEGLQCCQSPLLSLGLKLCGAAGGEHLGRQCAVSHRTPRRLISQPS